MEAGHFIRCKTDTATDIFTDLRLGLGEVVHDYLK